MKIEITCREKTKDQLNLILFILLFLIFFLQPAGLFSQKNLKLTGNIGWGYFGRYPFMNTINAWNYNQKIFSLNLSGHVLSQRFLQFSIGGDYTGLNYGGEQETSAYKNIGYHFQARFFTGRKVSFGFRLGRKKFDFDELLAQNSYFRTSSLYKGFDLSLTQIKILPTIRMRYTANRHRSNLFQSQDEHENRLELTADKSIGRSFLDLDLRMDQRKNQFFSLDRSHYNLRITDRIEFDSDTRLWLNNIYSRNLIALPGGDKINSNSNILSANFLKRFNPQVLGNAFSSFSISTGKDSKYYLFNLGSRIDYKLRQNLYITPEIQYLIDKRSSTLGEEVFNEPGAGLKLNYQKEFQWLRIISTIGFLYTYRHSDRSGGANDISQFLSLGLSAGKIQKILASINYQYSGINIDFSQTDNLEYSLFTPIGRKQNDHQARLELRSAALLRGLNVYLYSQYRNFWREYEFRGKTENRNFDNGLTLTTNGTRLTATYGVSQMLFGSTTAEFNMFSLVLDLRLFKGMEFRIQRFQRDRKDIFFSGDYEITLESYLRYNLGKLSLSAVYRRLDGKIGGVERKDEVLFIRISRSFMWDI